MSKPTVFYIYVLNAKELTQWINHKNCGSCFTCKKPFKIGDLIVSKTRNKYGTAKRHLNCAVQSNVLTSNVITINA